MVGLPNNASWAKRVKSEKFENIFGLTDLGQIVERDSDKDQLIKMAVFEKAHDLYAHLQLEQAGQGGASADRRGELEKLVAELATRVDAAKITGNFVLGERSAYDQAKLLCDDFCARVSSQPSLRV